MSDFYIGAQNDALYIIQGKPPAASNDHPDHDADRAVVAKVYDEDLARHLIASEAENAALKEENERFLKQRQQIENQLAVTQDNLLSAADDNRRLEARVAELEEEIGTLQNDLCRAVDS